MYSTLQALVPLLANRAAHPLQRINIQIYQHVAWVKFLLCFYTLWRQLHWEVAQGKELEWSRTDNGMGILPNLISCHPEVKMHLPGLKACEDDSDSHYDRWVSTGNIFFLLFGLFENQMFNEWLPSRVVGKVDKLTMHWQYLPVLVWCDAGSSKVQWLWKLSWNQRTTIPAPASSAIRPAELCLSHTVNSSQINTFIN